MYLHSHAPHTHYPLHPHRLMPLLLVPQILFSGVFVSNDLIPVWLRWSQYLCFLKYAVNLVTIEELGSSRSDPFNTASVDDFLDSLEIDEDLTWMYAGVMIGLFVMFRLMAMYFLKAKALDVN
jgi:hypothetical protein